MASRHAAPRLAPMRAATAAFFVAVGVRTSAGAEVGQLDVTDHTLQQQCDLVANGAVCANRGSSILLPSSVSAGLVGHWTFDQEDGRLALASDRLANLVFVQYRSREVFRVDITQVGNPLDRALLHTQALPCFPNGVGPSIRQPGYAFLMIFRKTTWQDDQWRFSIPNIWYFRLRLRSYQAHSSLLFEVSGNLTASALRGRHRTGCRKAAWMCLSVARTSEVGHSWQTWGALGSIGTCWAATRVSEGLVREVWPANLVCTHSRDAWSHVSNKPRDDRLGLSKTLGPAGPCLAARVSICPRHSRQWVPHPARGSEETEEPGIRTAKVST